MAGTRWKKWLPILVLIAIWTVEVFVVHQITAIRTYWPAYYVFKMAIRFVLTLSLVTFVCMILGRLALGVVIVGVAVFEMVVLSYSTYFRNSLSFFTILGQWKEGVQVVDGGFAILPKVALTIILIACGIKLFLLWNLGPIAHMRWRNRFLIALLCLTFYLGGIFAVHTRLDILARSWNTCKTGDVVFVVGYIPAWFGEWCFCKSSDGFLGKALAAIDQSTDNLTPKEPLLPPTHLFIAIQLESFGYSCLNRQVGGIELTPFLNRLAKSSAVYRLRVMHLQGSADSDFAFLTGIKPNGVVIPYKVPRFPWGSHSWVRMLREKGYHTVWINGFSKTFFFRETPYEEMGFKTRFCKEELGGGDTSHRFGLYTDRRLYAKSLECFQASPSSSAFHFIITATSHLPWTLDDPQQRGIFDKPGSTLENYLNSVHYADECLSNYYEKLPDGTLLIIFGDHSLPFLGGEDIGDEPGEEYSLCMIHKRGTDWRNTQQTREVALAGDYSIVDLGNFVKNSIRKWPAVGKTAHRSSYKIPTFDSSKSCSKRR